MTNWRLQFGEPFPFGATWLPEAQGFNFALYSKNASAIRLLLFERDDPYHPVFEVDLDPQSNKTGAVWHCFVGPAQLKGANCYAYRANGAAEAGNAFNWKKLLLDPWAKAVFFPPDFNREASTGAADNIGKAPLGQLFREETEPPRILAPAARHQHDLIIYELHVKGFTFDASSGVDEGLRGTFAGVTAKIPYLQELGITAVELMPVHQFDIKEENYWGYMTLNFFAPHNRYCVSKDGAVQKQEFKNMVQALHEAGIEVILDVIYNHTSEGGASGTFFSYKGIDNATYYLLTPGLQQYVNDAGTGNVLRASHKIVRKLVLDSLRYWVEEMGVDGFRFDLATIFTRNDDGSLNLTNPPLLEEISIDPVLSTVRLIAEPWDLFSSQLGTRFPGKSWAQWNGRFRDEIRRFVKSDNGFVPAAMQRVYGSNDLFPEGLPYSGHPFQSINFVTAHDGFTLYDLVSYNEKHNAANGEDNRDGADDNFSWNCGVEGDENLSSAVAALRQKQAKNLLCLLLLSNGIPMFRMGDEFLQTQQGNNNAYRQDNAISWLQWDKMETQAPFFRFVKGLLAFRKAHPSLCRHGYWGADVTWFGIGKEVDYRYDSHSFAFFLSGAGSGYADLYVMVNSYWQPLNFELQVGVPAEWRRVIDTGLESPGDIVAFAQAPVLTNPFYPVQDRSVVVLERGAA